MVARMAFLLLPIVALEKPRCTNVSEWGPVSCDNDEQEDVDIKIGEERLEDDEGSMSRFSKGTSPREGKETKTNQTFEQKLKLQVQFGLRPTPCSSFVKGCCC